LQDEQDLGTQKSDWKRWRTTLIVVAVFAALAAYVVLVDMKREPPTEQEPTPTPVPLLGLSIDDVQSLRITSDTPGQDGLNVLQILHRELEWRFSAPNASSVPKETCLDSPDGCIADPYIVHIAVDDLCHLSAQRILLEETNDLAQFGLDPVFLTLNITTLAGGQTEIRIGKQTPDGTSYYVQRAGNPRLYLVAQYTLQPFFDWLEEPPYQPAPLPTTTPGTE
jgi:hypothetical protein